MRVGPIAVFAIGPTRTCIWGYAIAPEDTVLVCAPDTMAVFAIGRAPGGYGGSSPREKAGCAPDTMAVFAIGRAPGGVRGASPGDNRVSGRATWEARTTGGLGPPGEDSMPFVYTTNLSEVRALAEKQARIAGLPDDRVVDFVIAVSEVAGNTVRHAQSPGSIEIWSDGGEIVCEIRDGGFIADPLAGSHPPPADSNGGHGLWLIHQVCDRVDLQSDKNGTVIRMHLSLRLRTAARRLSLMALLLCPLGCSLGTNNSLPFLNAQKTRSWTLLARVSAWQIACASTCCSPTWERLAWTEARCWRSPPAGSAGWCDE